MRRGDGPVGRAAAPRLSRHARGPVAPRAAILGDVTDLIAIPLSDGTQILATVKTNAQGVHTIGLECDSSKPGLVLHWGVIRAGYGEEWQLLPPELNPPGTTVYKQKALQSPFPAFGALQLVLDPGVSAVEFCLTTSQTGEWFNDEEEDAGLYTSEPMRLRRLRHEGSPMRAKVPPARCVCWLDATAEWSDTA